MTRRGGGKDMQIHSISYFYPSEHDEDTKQKKSREWVDVDTVVLKKSTGEKIWIMMNDNIMMEDDDNEVPFTSLKSLNLGVSADTNDVSSIKFEGQENDEDGQNSTKENVALIKKGVYGKPFKIDATSEDLGDLNQVDRLKLFKKIVSQF